MTKTKISPITNHPVPSLHQLVNYAQNNRPRFTIAVCQQRLPLSKAILDSFSLFPSLSRCTWPLNCWGELCLVHCWHYGRATSRRFSIWCGPHSRSNIPSIPSHPEVARWQNLIPSFPCIAPGWRAWGAIQGKEGIKFCSVAEWSHSQEARRAKHIRS